MRYSNISWRKSSHSNNIGGNCVEAGACAIDLIAVRDSKDRAAGMILASGQEWSSLLNLVSGDQLLLG